MIDDKILNEIAPEVFAQNLTSISTVYLNMRLITLIKDMFSKNIIKIIQTEHTYSQYYWRNFVEKKKERKRTCQNFKNTLCYFMLLSVC